MGEEVRIPVTLVVRSVTWRPAGEAAPAEPAAQISLGPNDAHLSVEASLHPDPALDELIEQAKRDHFRNKAAAAANARKQAREEEAARWEPKTIRPGTSPVVARLYGNLLQPRQTPAASGPASPTGAVMASKKPDAGAGQGTRSLPPQTSPRMTGAAQDRAANVEDVGLLRGAGDLPRPGTTSTRGLVQYAANESTLPDVGVTGGETAEQPGRRSTHSKSSDEELSDFRSFLTDTDREGPPQRNVYLDSTKHPTVGLGHKVVSGDHLKLGDPVGPDQIDALFRVDGGDALAAARSQMAEAGIKDENFLLALAAVNFQLGPNWKNPPGPSEATTKRLQMRSVDQIGLLSHPNA